MLLFEPRRADQDLGDRLGIRHRVAQLGDLCTLVLPDSNHHRPTLPRNGRRGCWRGLGDLRTLVDHSTELLTEDTVGLAGAEHDGVHPLSELDRRGHGHGPLGTALVLLEHLSAVEGHADLRHPTARSDHSRHHAHLVGHAQSVLRVAEVYGQGNAFLVVDRADLLVDHPIGLGGGDHQDVLPLAQLEGEVHCQDPLRLLLFQARDLYAVHRDDNPADSLAARHEPRQRDTFLVHPGLVSWRGDGHLYRWQGSDRCQLWGQQEGDDAECRLRQATAVTAGDGARGGWRWRWLVVEDNAGRLGGVPLRIGGRD